MTPEAERMRDVIDMHEFGVALYRQRMRRENPDADEAEIEALTDRWLATAPSPDGLRFASRDAARGRAV